MSDLKINNITDRTGSCGPVIAGVSTVSTTGAFTVPVGATEFRGGRGRGVILAGGAPTQTKNCEFITIATTGNAQDFGDLSQARTSPGGCASATRSFSMGGDVSPSGGTNTTLIEYVITSSSGGGSHFGDLTVGRRYPGGVSDSTRGMANGGTSPTPGVNTNIIDYFTMASTGDASDFGDLMSQRTYLTGAGCQSPTRGFVAGGHMPAVTSLIEFYTIQSKGNSTQFGELRSGRSGLSAGSNTTRGIFAAGATPSTINNIEYITMSTEGNAADFGDLKAAGAYTGAGMYSATRGVHAGGYPQVNTIQYITIASTGNAIDFGDLVEIRSSFAGSSDSHGGLG